MGHGRPAAKAKSTLLWGLLFFIAAQIGLNIYIDWRRPDIYDPEYNARLTALKERIAETGRAPPQRKLAGKS